MSLALPTVIHEVMNDMINNGETFQSKEALYQYMDRSLVKLTNVVKEALGVSNAVAKQRVRSTVDSMLGWGLGEQLITSDNTTSNDN